MEIKKLISFDFDDTLVHSPLPQEGKLIWKEKTGEDWPHRGWWSKPESLDMEIFDIPLNKKIYRRYKQAISDPDNYVILATGRIAPLKDEVYTILGHYGLSFDETHLNPSIDTFEFKSNLFAKLIYELQPEEFIMYDDRQEHLVRFVQWANAMPCKVTIIDAISGEEFKPQNNPLQESIKRILKEEVVKKYPKPTPKMEQLVYDWLDNYFEGSQMYEDEVWDNHRFDFEFCKNGRDIAELITEFEDESPDWGPQDERPLSERKFKEASLHIYPAMVDELLSDIPIRRHYLIYLIEEWFEDTYLDKIQRTLNRNDLHLDRVSVSTYKKEGSLCVPPIKTIPEDVTEEDMIQHILKTTLYKRNEILKHEDEKPGWIEKTYLQKLRSAEYDRLNGR